MTRSSCPLLLGWAAVLPVAAAAALSPLRDVLASTSTALVLVLVVVAIAVRGDRAAGVLAAVAAAVAFDFFLTAPYLTLAIHDATDVETAVLLVAVGIAVTEVAQWARRELDRAGHRAGYLAGITTAARLAGHDTGREELATLVARLVADVLDLDDCRFSSAPPRPARPRLHDDGTVTWGDELVDVDRDGLPAMDVIELPLPAGRGVLLLTASTRVRHPSLEQRQVAATLAGQIALVPSTRH